MGALQHCSTRSSRLPAAASKKHAKKKKGELECASESTPGPALYPTLEEGWGLSFPLSPRCACWLRRACYMFLHSHLADSLLARPFMPIRSLTARTMPSCVALWGAGLVAAVSSEQVQHPIARAGCASAELPLRWRPLPLHGHWPGLFARPRADVGLQRSRGRARPAACC